MCKVHLFPYKSQFDTEFNVIPGNTSSPIIFLNVIRSGHYLLLHFGHRQMSP
jgi:hypothetical protein